MPRCFLIITKLKAKQAQFWCPIQEYGVILWKFECKVRSKINEIRNIQNSRNNIITHLSKTRIWNLIDYANKSNKRYTKDWIHLEMRIHVYLPFYINKKEIFSNSSVQFSHSVVSNSLQPHESQHAKASLSITISWTSLKFTSIKSVMPSSHLILCRPLLLLPPIPPSIRVFSNESTLCMRWPKYWSFSFSISPSKEHSGYIWIKK